MSLTCSSSSLSAPVAKEVTMRNQFPVRNDSLLSNNDTVMYRSSNTLSFRRLMIMFALLYFWLFTSRAYIRSCALISQHHFIGLYLQTLRVAPLSIKRRTELSQSMDFAITSARCPGSVCRIGGRKTFKLSRVLRSTLCVPLADDALYRTQSANEEPFPIHQSPGSCIPDHMPRTVTHWR